MQNPSGQHQARITVTIRPAGLTAVVLLVRWPIGGWPLRRSKITRL